MGTGGIIAVPLILARSKGIRAIKLALIRRRNLRFLSGGGEELQALIHMLQAYFAFPCCGGQVLQHLVFYGEGRIRFKWDRMSSFRQLSSP